MSDAGLTPPQGPRFGAIGASLVSAGCLLRGLPLFFAAAPGTPLRVLGIVALDTLHVLRRSRPMRRRTIRELAMFLDLEGFANKSWDHKALCAADYRALEQRLEQAGLGPCVMEYRDRLRELESGRPTIGGDGEAVRSYREAVARLSLATAAAIALNVDGRAHDSLAAHGDSDVDTLFRILMQCQVIDDVLDYQEDLSAGLPSFLTAPASLPRALASTADAARSYAVAAERSSNAIFPLRLALFLVSTLARIVIRAATPRYGQAQQFAQ